jgi:hypothetical protein
LFAKSDSSDIHVLNDGLWNVSHRRIPPATSALSTFFENMSAHKGSAAMPHVVCFETPPQHFQSKGGLYSAKPGMIGMGCMKKVSMDGMRKHELRNRITLGILNSSSLQETTPMHLFRTWELFAPHPKLHVQYSLGKLDCAHWGEYDGGDLTALVKILLSDLSRTFWSSRQT